MKAILRIGAVIMMGFLSSSAFAQPIFDKYICLSESHSEYIDDNIQASESDNICDEGTRVHFVASGDTGIGTVTLDRLGAGPHRVNVMVDWVPNATGILTVEVYYERRESNSIGNCHWEDWVHMYTYKFHRLNASPSGVFSGTKIIPVQDPQSQTIFNLSYLPASNYPSSLTATKIRYNNGTQVVEHDIVKSGSTYSPTAIQYQATGFGAFYLSSEVLDNCGQWHSLPSQRLGIVPSCYQDTLLIDLTVAGVVPYGDQSYGINANQIYALAVTGLTDYTSHYDWSIVGGGTDVELTGNSFKVLAEIGSYRIELVPKTGRSACPTPEALVIVVGGQNLTFEHEHSCAITLPDDLPAFGYVVDEFVLQHFSATVISNRSVTIKPGMSVELGGDIIVESQDEDEEIGPDALMNFTEQTIFDEYGQVIGSNKSYFDEGGKLLQTQYKDLANQSVLASNVIYDAYGRAAISTLSAPVRSSTNENQVDECNAALSPDRTLIFGYKEDFVKASGEGTPVYDYTHFDIYNNLETQVDKENNPIPLDASQEGTLGWYYSTNNTIEPLTAVTEYPYARTLFHRDGSGEVKGSTKPGDAFKAGGGNIAFADNEPVLATDEILGKYLSMRENELALSHVSLEGEFFKSIVTDANGMRTETYADKSGKTIISLYYGDQVTPITKSYQFYDLAGRLLVSVSPNGVKAYEKPAPNNIAFDLIDKTRYFYNSKGLLASLEETDAGVTEYVYRKDGSIRFSQNQKQRDAVPASFSYTNYDKAGRPIESGEYIIGEGGIAFKSQAMKGILESVASDGGLPGGTGVKQDRVVTFYDEPVTVPGGYVQGFLLGAVSYNKNDNVTTYYSYDERGRVEWMIQDVLALGVKTVHYRYGPNGAVQEVLYQKDNATERFSHFYEYDEDSRLAKVYTSTSELQYNKLGEVTNLETLKLQATYYYYLHGPLKRIELAGDLQGIDYIYTADGALKSINSANPSADPGQDGDPTQPIPFRKDVFGMSLEYFNGDYNGANGRIDNATISTVNYPEQHTGLIRAMRWHSPVETGKQFAYAYQYDNRYQFKSANWGTISGNNFINNGTDAHIISTNKSGSYQESISDYDLNGNISSLNRKNSAADNIANFKYSYAENKNKLEKILDLDNDLEVIKEYSYTKIGELETEKNSEGVVDKKVVYDVSGKVKAVYRDEAKTKLAVEFTYDDRGFRLSKTGFSEEGTAVARTWYVRDASGSVMATYEQDLIGTHPIEVTELPVYASGRMGFYKPQFDFYMYELNDHLGNVRAVIGQPLTVEYQATMESERSAEESVDFENLGSQNIETWNSTPATVTLNNETYPIEPANQVDRLCNVIVGAEPARGPLGTGIRLLVHPGDNITAQVAVKYTDFIAPNQVNIPLAAAMLGNIFPSAPLRIDGSSIFSAVEGFNFAAWPAWEDLDDQQPRAFLNCLLFDNDGNLQLFDFAQVSSAAKITGSNPHEILSLNIEAKKEGFIYIYLSNYSNQNTEVFFDDLKVTHTYSDIVAGGDFYPFGLAIKDRQIERDFYRHGYQGKFSERDEETGWNHFELREYDPVIGRWLVRDPKKEFHSPYLANGNNPISTTDPDGGTTKKPHIAGGYINPDNFFKRSYNFLFGYSFLNDAYKFQNENPDIAVTYNFNEEGLPMSAQAFIDFEYSSFDPATCEDACHQGRWEVSFGGFSAGIQYSITLLPGPQSTWSVGGGSQLWTATSKLSSVRNAFLHWKKHAKEFPELLNAKQYVAAAKNFLKNSPQGTLVKHRANGDILKYHPGTNTFGVMNANGVPRTMFRPSDGMDYWLKQIE